MVASVKRLTSDLNELLFELASQLQLPPESHRLARAEYAALARVLADSELGALDLAVYPQGSYVLGTTVEPVRRDDFDLDAVVVFPPSSKVLPQSLPEATGRALLAAPRYAGIVELRDRCSRLHISKSFHVDVVSALDAGLGTTQILVPARSGSSWTFELSDPKGHARWFRLQELAPGVEFSMKAMEVEKLPPVQPLDEKSVLQVAVQLTKRHHQWFVEDEHVRTPSITLTTIAAQAAGHIPDLSTAMEVIVQQLLEIASAPIPPFVPNPTNPTENLGRKWWEADVYPTFRRSVADLANKWESVLRSQGTNSGDTLGVLYEMFGEHPVKRALSETAKRRAAARSVGDLFTRPTGQLVVGASPGLTRNRDHVFFGDVDGF